MSVHLFVICLLIAGICTVNFANKSQPSIAILPGSSIEDVLVFLMLYSQASLAFVSVIFTYMFTSLHIYVLASIVTATVGAAWVLSVIPMYPIVMNLCTVSNYVVVAFCLFPNVPLFLTCTIARQMLTKELGITASNSNQLTLRSKWITIYRLQGLLFLDIVIYTLVGYLTEKEFHNGISVFQQIVSRFKRMTRRHKFGSVKKESDAQSLHGLECRNVWKIYRYFGRPEEVAISNCNVWCPPAQITLLVGPNGAGKSTLLHLISGVTQMTHGSIRFNGSPQKVVKYHRNLGFCFQEDILFDKLTVNEHLKLLSKLRGNVKSTGEGVEEIRKSLRLNDVQNVMSSELSGGKRRALCIAMALCGGSRLVLLDEPTSSLDRYRRSDLWNLLARIKQNRTIVLSTHHCQEAETVADNAVIIIDGQVAHAGQLKQVKAEIGDTYKLRIDMEDITAEGYYLSNNSSPVMKKSKSVQIKFKENGDLSLMDRIRSLHLEYAPDAANRLSVSKMNMLEAVITQDENIFKYGTEEIEEFQKMRELMSLLSMGRIQTGFCCRWQSYAGMSWKIFRLWSRNKLIAIHRLLIPIAALLYIIMCFIQPQFPPPRHLSLNLRSYLKLDKVMIWHDVGGDNSYISRVLLDELKSEAVEVVTASFSRCPSLMCSDSDTATYPLIFEISRITASSESRCTTHFDNEYMHLLPIVNSIYNRMMARIAMTGQRYFNLTVSSYPLLASSAEKTNNWSEKRMFGNVLAVYITMACSVMSCSIAMGIMHEKVSKFKSLLGSAAVSKHVYWITTYVWDMAFMLVSAMILLGIFQGFCGCHQVDPEPFVADGFFIILSGTILYGAAQLPLIYCISQFFNSMTATVTATTVTTMITGTTAATIADFLSTPSFKLSGQIPWIDGIFLICPTYCFHQLFSNLYTNYRIRSVCMSKNVAIACRMLRKVMHPCCKDRCGENCVTYECNLWSMRRPGVGRLFLAFILDMLLFWGILYLLESRWYSRKNRLTITKDKKNSNIVIEDLSVKRRRIDILKNLWFKTETMRSTCIVGGNSSGKSTFLNTLSGVQPYKHGSVKVHGFEVKLWPKQASQMVAYIPQDVQLSEKLTAREVLWFYSYITGVRQNCIDEVVSRTLDFMGIQEYAKWKISTLSGGTKRKVSIGLALIFNKDIVVLDEPGAGLDEKSKQLAYRLLDCQRLLNKTVIITSHKLQGMEADRCDIMLLRSGVLTALSTNDSNDTNGIHLPHGNCMHVIYNWSPGGFCQQLLDQFGSERLTCLSSDQTQAVFYVAKSDMCYLVHLVEILHRLHFSGVLAWYSIRPWNKSDQVDHISILIQLIEEMLDKINQKMMFDSHSMLFL